MYTLFFSFPEEPNVEGVSHYVTLPTEDEMNSREAIVVTKRNRMLRDLKEFYEKFDVAYEGGVDTDEVCEILSREKPEVRVVVGKQTDRKNEDTGEEYPDANNIRRFLLGLGEVWLGQVRSGDVWRGGVWSGDVG
jgi:hypothetical protein